MVTDVNVLRSVEGIVLIIIVMQNGSTWNHIISKTAVTSYTNITSLYNI